MGDAELSARRRLRGLPRAIGALLAARATRAALARPRADAGEGQARPGGGADPARRELPRDRGAETAVAWLLILAAVCAFGFTAVYVVESTNAQLLGLALGGALALLAAACIIAGKLVVPQETHVEERGLLLDEAQLEQNLEIIEAGGEGISRRTLLTGAAGLAGAGLLTAAATPLASLGPDPEGVHQTPWHAGVRLVDDRGTPYSAAAIEIGTFYTALPEGGDPESFGAGLLVVRLPTDLIRLPAARARWAPQGILAYSKICPHAGCAISLYRYPTYQPTSSPPAFTCPCHYSTFLPGEGGRLVFGPAGRSLPQLPLTVDGEGNLRAAAGFHEDIGPSWWSVKRSQS